MHEHHATNPLEGNLLLASLSPADARLIAPHLQRIELPRGAMPVQPAWPIARLLFPETVVIGISVRGSGARVTEIGLVGNEGLVGWPVLLGCERADHSATVRLAGGSALAIPAANALKLTEQSATLRIRLLGFVHGFMAQMSETLAAYANGSAGERIARHLLMLHDRVAGDELAITHKELGAMLSLRRPSVTDCLHLLEGEHAIRCWRGRIIVRDRDLLERLAQGTVRRARPVPAVPAAQFAGL